MAYSCYIPYQQQHNTFIPPSEYQYPTCYYPSINPPFSTFIPYQQQHIISPNIPFTTPSQNFSYNHGYTPHQQPPFTLPSTTIPLSASPPYTSFTPSQNPHISYQQQPQNFNSQLETFYQDLETLKQYLIETHESSNKYREELK